MRSEWVLKKVKREILGSDDRQKLLDRNVRADSEERQRRINRFG